MRSRQIEERQRRASPGDSVSLSTVARTSGPEASKWNALFSLGGMMRNAKLGNARVAKMHLSLKCCGMISRNTPALCGVWFPAMYDRHNPVIAAAMRSNLDCFKRGAYFTIASIRQKIFNVPLMVDSFEVEGPSSEYAWGHKRDAVAWIDEHAADLRDVLLTYDPRNLATLPLALAHVTECPGLGIVKGAFLLQLMGFDIACFDSRNCARLSLDRNAMRARKSLSHKARQRRIVQYVNAASGKARLFWNDWCIDVGNAYGFKPREVSAMHLCIAKRKQYSLEETFA